MYAVYLGYFPQAAQEIGKITSRRARDIEVQTLEEGSTEPDVRLVYSYHD